MEAPNEPASNTESPTDEILNPPPTEEAPVSPFNTLWIEFARGRQRISPPHSPALPTSVTPLSAEQSSTSKLPRVDLRSLEYATDYDSNLMCPICHVPFIEPVVLSCDHTFCEECFNQYTTGAPPNDRSTCPTCRTHSLGRVRKASRLIRNMCNEIRVHCPNESCKIVTPRGCIQQHIFSDCPEELLSCPDEKCSKQTKRRNFVPDHCIHNTHVECECGAKIQLGRGEWLRHKDQECPHIQPNASRQEDPQTSTPRLQCPGGHFGCTESPTTDNMDTHIHTCVFARLAPYLEKQSLLLKSAQEQLTMAKLRNEILETSFTRLEEVITSTIQPKLDGLYTSMFGTIPEFPIPTTNTTNDNDSVSDIEEIPRPDLYNSPSIPVSQSLETFPLPDNFVTHPNSDPSHRQTSTSTFTFSPSQNIHTFDPVTTHLLTTTSTHSSHLSSLDQSIQTLTSQLHDLDARSSMALMNETLRIREDLNIFNGAMHSTRTQVQWLLNRERMLGQREAMTSGWAAGPATRGRPLPQTSLSGSTGPTPSSAETSNPNNGSGSTNGDFGASTPTQASVAFTPGDNITNRPPITSATAASTATSNMGYRPSTIERNMSSAWATSQGGNVAGVGGGQSSSGYSSTATSPIFGAARPSLRRASGGSSQERVKL